MSIISVMPWMRENRKKREEKNLKYKTLTELERTHKYMLRIIFGVFFSAMDIE